jgi:hypothetical protein
MVAIIVEGKGDKEILEQICKAYSLPVEKIDYQNFEGKDNILNIDHKYYDELEKQITDLEKIDKILIIVDADYKDDKNPDRGFEATEKKLKKVIYDLNFNISIDYFIMCDEKREGNLESFLLSILDNEQKECISEFKKCYFHQLSDKFVYNTLYKDKRHPFDFNHKNFDILREKLENLFK